MSAFKKRTINVKLISWLLITAVLMVAFLPAHYHLHHLSDAAVTASTIGDGTHEHVIDLHFFGDTNALSHHEGDVTKIETSPDSMVKKAYSVIFLMLFLAFFLVLLSGQIKCLRNNSLRDFLNISRISPHFTPLLRAPPHLS